MAEIIPPEVPPQPLNPPDPGNGGRGRSITCECCGSKLDRHGNLLRRGDLAKQMIDAEDTIAELKKQNAKIAEDLAAAQRTIDELKAAQPKERTPLWKREV
jgi:hypothetical protein